MLAKDFVRTNSERFAPLAEQLRRNMRDIQEARQGQDLAAFEQSQEQLRGALQELAVLRTEYEPGLFTLLTDAQRKTYAALRPDLLRPGLLFGAMQQAGGMSPVTRRLADGATLMPLTETGNSEYQGARGGLYPDGSNERPLVHETAGRTLAAKIRALDQAGKPNPKGKIALLTIGMSNTMQASMGFQEIARADAEVNPQVVIVNGAQGGQTAARTQDPDDHASGTVYWTAVDERLKNAGVSAEQVQAVWIKQADANPTEGFPEYAHKLENELARIVQVLHARFPNLRLAYLSSRTFGGFAKTPLNPEPYAYESGFAVKWLIERQIKGDPALNYDPAKGPVMAPWLSWGPYLWANGAKKRADGFYYEPSDFRESDGTHESPAGQAKVGRELLKFFKTDSTTKGWFRKAS